LRRLCRGVIGGGRFHCATTSSAVIAGLSCIWQLVVTSRPETGAGVFLLGALTPTRSRWCPSTPPFQAGSRVSGAEQEIIAFWPDESPEGSRGRRSNSRLGTRREGTSEGGSRNRPGPHGDRIPRLSRPIHPSAHAYSCRSSNPAPIPTHYRAYRRGRTHWAETIPPAPFCRH
jgi:hypothetical protein